MNALVHEIIQFPVVYINIEYTYGMTDLTVAEYKPDIDDLVIFTCC